MSLFGYENNQSLTLVPRLASLQFLELLGRQIMFLSYLGIGKHPSRFDSHPKAWSC